MVLGIQQPPSTRPFGRHVRTCTRPRFIQMMQFTPTMMKRALVGLAIAVVGCEDPNVPDDIHEFVDVATGGDHTCAITADGTAYCWGRGADGQLGTGDLENQFIPRRVETNIAFKTITTGDAHTCALDQSGRAYCWGWTAFYQLGVVGASDTRVPGLIDGNERFASISAGAHHTCGIALDQRVFCWGYNRWGQNGN